MMKRLLGIILTLLLVLTSTAIAQETDEKVVLTYYSWGDEEPLMRALVDDFNATHENIRVEMTVMYGDTAFVDKIVTLGAGGTEFDLLGVATMKQYVQWRDFGWLADLTELIQADSIDLSVYGVGFASLADSENRFYGLPYRFSSHALFYNKLLFDEAGLPYPEQMTWEQFAELATKLTFTREDGTKQWGSFMPTWLGEPYGAIQQGSSVVDDDTAPLQYWLGMLNRLYNVDKCQMSWEEMTATSADWISLFANGNVAMIPNGEFTIANYMDALANQPELAGKSEMGITYLPYPEGGKPGTSVGGANTFISVSATSKHLAESFEFVKYVSSAAVANKLIDMGRFPACVTDEVVEYFLANIGIDGADALLLSETSYEAPPVAEFAEADAIWREEKELCLVGAQTVEESIANFATRRAEIQVD